MKIGKSKRKRKNVAVRRKSRTAKTATKRSLQNVAAASTLHIGEGLWRFLSLAGSIVLIIITIVAGVELGRFYNDSEYWRLQKVQFSGQQMISEVALRDTFEYFVKESGYTGQVRIFDIDIEQLRSYYLASITPLREVMVTRRFPGTLSIVVEEREPIALVRFGDQVFFQVDQEGVVFRIHTPEDSQYPVLKGLDGIQLVVGEKNESPQLQAGLNLLQLLDSRWLPRIAEIDVGNPADLIAWVDGYKVVLGDGGFGEKFNTLDKLIQQLSGRRVEYINLRSALRPAVKPLSEREGG